MIEVKPVTPELIGDLNSLFCSNRYTGKCWCMWHIISVKSFHGGGAAQNRRLFAELIERENIPAGLLAYKNNQPIGWCAVGPRERYARAIKTPTYRQVAKDTLATVWLSPCFFVHSEARGKGITQILLKSAIRLATEHNAMALDGFPFTSDKRRSSSQIHVGFESTFLACGFEPIHRPSQSRVVMRRTL